jgi:S-adenosylmethionine:tRNA ribosyltransferase-isomerase
VGGVARAGGAQEGRMTGSEGTPDPGPDVAPASAAVEDVVPVAAGDAGSFVLALEDLDYELPEVLIAQRPADPRDASRLLVYRRARGHVEDRVFGDLPGLLRQGDVLVRNDTRVFPARTYFRRATGARIEALFLRPSGASIPGAAASVEAAGPRTEEWEVLLRGRPRRGEVLASDTLGDAWTLACAAPFGDGRWLVRSHGERSVLDLLEEAGVTPLPPYVHEALSDPERYQTTYARTLGSAAAPTAGLHFTPELDAALAGAGVTVETVTLHVGLGTFQPLREETLAAGRLHGESFAVDAAVWARLLAARADGRRVVAVGTTSMRTLEHLARTAGGLGASSVGTAAGSVLSGETELFISPGFEFRIVDALITNFHLPCTSLLALVMAFCGVAETRRIYAHAVAEGYRFYSFGDAMLAL